MDPVRAANKDLPEAEIHHEEKQKYEIVFEHRENRANAPIRINQAVHRISQSRSANRCRPAAVPPILPLHAFSISALLCGADFTDPVYSAFSLSSQAMVIQLMKSDRLP